MKYKMWNRGETGTTLIAIQSLLSIVAILGIFHCNIRRMQVVLFLLLNARCFNIDVGSDDDFVLVVGGDDNFVARMFYFCCLGCCCCL